MTGFALALVILIQTPASGPTRSLDLYFIDVVGGAATLVVTPERESILIDSGWPGNDDRDPKRIEAVLRNEAKLDHLDNLITTHWHTDHFGGVAGLNQRIRIDRFWDRGLPDPKVADGDRGRFPDGPSGTDPLGIAYRAASVGKRTRLTAGVRLPVQGKTQVQILAASGETINNPQAPANPLCDTAPPDQAVDSSDNARSIVLRIRLGAFEFLDCGDLTWNIEKKLVCPLDQIGPVDLFQVTHHGMDISNHPTLLATVAPTVTVMNNGPRKGGSPATVRRLQQVASIQAAYQLHRNSSNEANANTDAALIANTPGTEGQFIHVSVVADGQTYSVQIGGTGPKREFRSK